MKLKHSLSTLTICIIVSVSVFQVKARTIGVQTLGEYTHESTQEADNGPITHIFTGPDGFNQTLVTGPDVNNVESLSDPSGVTFTISAQDGSKRQTIGPLKSNQFKVSVSQTSISTAKNSGNEMFEISAPHPRVFDPCFPFNCKEEIVLLRKPMNSRPRQRIIVIETDEEPLPAPLPGPFPVGVSGPAPAPAPVRGGKRKLTTAKPSQTNLFEDCFPFCSKD